MSLKFAESLLVVPKSYDDTKLHHWLALYAAVSIISWTGLLQKIGKVLHHALSASTESFLPLVHAGLVPDFAIRFGIRVQLRDHLYILDNEQTVTETLATKMDIVQKLTTQPIAIETAAANEQHYEVPYGFYDLCLGPAKKYSSGLWPTPQTTFAESEVHMLELYARRAQLQDGMKIVDLGCGWGSLTLFLAAKYPNAKITSISNSASQKEYILKTAASRGLNVDNINVITCNVADDKGALSVVKDNDIVMTIEMFEHMKNYQVLMEKVQGFLKPNGKLFVHIFTHKDYAYHFDKGWMSDNFFTGGTMPSDDLLLYFAQDFSIQKHWRVNGQNYEKTSNAWLDTLDMNWRNGKLKPVLKEAYGEGKEREWYVNWRLFFLACAELWGYDEGEEWIVSHYLFQKRS